MGMFGGETSDVIVVGHGNQEAVSRARINLGILLCVGEDEKYRRWYNLYTAGYRAAIEEGLVEVAVPAWHPQFFKLKSVLESPTQHGIGGLVDPTGFNSWAGRGVASSILPNVKEPLRCQDENA